LEENEFQKLRHDVLIKAGIKVITPGDAKLLSKDIFRLTHRFISETTLKRFFGFSKTSSKFSKYTILSLIEYLGTDTVDLRTSPVTTSNAIMSGKEDLPEFLAEICRKDKDKLTDDEYLELFKIENQQYIIGIYQGGITVYKQQIRALNIFNALINTGKIRVEDDFTIGIVGAGVAGLTFAAAAMKSNMIVRIYEKEPHYLHMQSGCDTRKIHPNIYEWPDSGSLFPYAKMPVLSWEYDTASNVSKQIVKEFRKVRAVHSSNFEDYTRMNILSVENNDIKGQKKIKITAEHVESKRKVPGFCDLIVYAVGYGIEGGVNVASRTPSYWRNDSLGQSNLRDGNNNYMISGLGDGGLVDLFRLKLYDFSYEYILSVFQSNEKAYNSLKQKLSDIKLRGLQEENIADTFLEYEFSRLTVLDYDYILKEFENGERIRKNIKVTMNGNGTTFISSLDFKKISLLNAFLAFILHKEHFDFESGKLEHRISEQKYYLNGREIDGENLIVRHGTQKTAVINGLPFSEDAKQRLKHLEIAQSITLPYGLVKPRWTTTEINNHFLRGNNTRNSSTIGPIKEKKIEYLTPQTISVCTGFISVLNSVLEKFNDCNHDYRTSIYRVINVRGEPHFQQMTSFFGTKNLSGDGSAKRVFNLGRGNIGYSFATGKPLLIERSDEVDFEKIVDLLELKSYYKEINEPKAFLTLPILADYEYMDSEYNRHKGIAANAVLYIDSTNIHYFNNPAVIEAIMSVARGFVHSIDHMLTHEQLFMADLEFCPLNINGNKYGEDLSKNKCYIEPKLGDTDKMPKFKSYYSFDMMNNSPERFV
jgi:hypothetical protein